MLVTSEGAIKDPVVHANPATGGWRVSFVLVPGDAALCDLRCIRSEARSASLRSGVTDGRRKSCQSIRDASRRGGARAPAPSGDASGDAGAACAPMGSDRARGQRAPRGGERRRIVVLTCVLALTAVASYEMYRVLTVHSMTTLQLAFLVLFTLTFVWIALPCVCGLAGLLALWRGRSVSGLSLPPCIPSHLTTRTALVMPIYNEDPSRIFAGLQAIYESLDALGAMASFDFFILSDTTDPEVWLEEERGFYALRQRTAGDTHIFYRHRRKNRRKAGNIADFCQRWGARYEHMVILDADSLMTGEALVRLAAAMESQLQVGLIQTLPLMINRNTLFARAQQFAARVYGPIIAAGVAYWHLGDSSYWGHNAIIRTRAFLAHAGLPDLPGPPPFGGPILSHDFVEAALLRRAGGTSIWCQKSWAATKKAPLAAGLCRPRSALVPGQSPA